MTVSVAKFRPQINKQNDIQNRLTRVWALFVHVEHQLIHEYSSTMKTTLPLKLSGP